MTNTELAGRLGLVALRLHAVLAARYQAIDALLSAPATTAQQLADTLDLIGDAERILARVALRSARPRDLHQLGRTLGALPALKQTLATLDSPLLAELDDTIGRHREESRLLERAIVENPPALIRDGGVIAEGFDDELDELRGIADNADQYLSDLEAREKERTGIPTLKLGYNRVHGYFIEISKSQADKAPTEYVRRQTLKGAERYITPELKSFEDKVLSARERALSREKQLYEALLDELLTSLVELKASAAAVAAVDVLACLSERAETLGLSKPSLTERSVIDIEGGRHLVVEAVIDTPFIANDLSLHDARKLLIITGPNMVAFEARSQQQVRDLHSAALAAGGSDEGPPGFRDTYGPRFYVGYLRDPQGNKIALFSSNPDEPGRDG